MAENILHFAGVRLRVNGTGNLKMKLFSLDKVESLTLAPIAMQTLTAREPTRLCNFVQQRAILRVETTEINEFMSFNRIILFTKAIYTQFPGLD